MALRSSLKTNTENKDDGICAPVDYLLHQLFLTASSQEKNWEIEVINILKLNPAITRMPENHFKTYFSPYGDEPKLDPILFLWINVISHPRLKNLMELMILFHSSFDEIFISINFNEITTLSKLSAYYENKINDIVSTFKNYNLKYFQEKFECSLLYCIHIVMVAYRRAKESRWSSPDYIKQLSNSITILLPLISKETLQRYTIKVDEGDWGRERMSTLERAIETQNIDFVRILLEKGHITHMGKPVNTDNWDFSPFCSTTYTVFKMTELSCQTAESKQLALLLAQFDSCYDVLTLANSLSDDIKAKHVLIPEHVNHQKVLAQTVYSDLNNQLPHPITRLIASYAGFFQPIQSQEVTYPFPMASFPNDLPQATETSLQENICDGSSKESSEVNDAWKCIIQ